MVRQTFLQYEDGSFAPEIMAGVAHGPPVDVWGLGQVLNNLLAFTKATDDHPLSQLVHEMVSDEPDQRPTIKEISARLEAIKVSK